MGCLIGNENVIYDDIIESIIAVLEAKDTYTAEHSKRVSDMSSRLCCFLKLSDADTEIIHIAGYVHDVGKVGIPDFILNKTEKLNEFEWKQIKLHPEIGAKILEETDNLSGISKIILHHHERFDGKGYPAGLKGEDIPYGARILAVCDSIDAMSSKRTYRDSLPVSICRAEIEKNIGIMYDEQIALCMLAHWNDIVL